MICIVVASIFVVCARPLFFLVPRAPWFVVRGGGRVARWPAAAVVVVVGWSGVFFVVWFCGAFGGCLGTKS